MGSQKTMHTELQTVVQSPLHSQQTLDMQSVIPALQSVLPNSIHQSTSQFQLFVQSSSVVYKTDDPLSELQLIFIFNINKNNYNFYSIKI